ncbi:proclotting enzyme isoform X1 [Lutzomyia longipalpis]|uniref:proclotting enzyme isoform X1 n=1 Tax=Lutzomyia longipalpis TaxID=7200 RepID=UPI002484475B|nr:proclotting enzyme isoform X1 [Lutzomyia longipalpis]
MSKTWIIITFGAIVTLVEFTLGQHTQKSSRMYSNENGFNLQPFYTHQSDHHPHHSQYTFLTSRRLSEVDRMGYPVEYYRIPNMPVQSYQDPTKVTRIRRQDTQERGLSPVAFSRISETLGALNTVGQYLVNMTRGESAPIIHTSGSSSTDNVPSAILTLTSNVLGKNITNTIEPLIKQMGNINLGQNTSTKSHDNSTTTKDKRKASAKDIREPATSVQSKDSEHRCRTPDGSPGKCQDLSSCPSLLLDLGHLRDSLCFKSLFVPGVCCPTRESTVLTTQRPVQYPIKPRPETTTAQSLVIKPVASYTTTTSRPLIPVFTVPSGQGGESNALDADDNSIGHIIDPNDCGQQEYTTGRIVGGVESPNGEWPWMAAIFLHGPKRTEFWCGGSLIGTKYVLTAAHCTRDSRQRPFAPRQFTVRLGDVDLSTDDEPSAPVTFKVKEVRAHPRFSRVGFYNDIAVIVLDKPVRKSKYVIPVCLPTRSLPAPDRLAGRRGTVVGWGTTYYGGKESTTQRQANLPLWRNEDCNRAYFQPITENFLCAGYSEGGVDACQGDSGGPLMMKVDSRWTQLGIVSFGNKCGEPGYPGVYTRVSEYMDWIRETTRN